MSDWKHFFYKAFKNLNFMATWCINTEKNIGKNDFVGTNKIGYHIDDLRQTACLVVNPIKVNSFAYLFNCTTVGRASD